MDSKLNSEIELVIDAVPSGLEKVIHNLATLFVEREFSERANLSDKVIQSLRPH